MAQEPFTDEEVDFIRGLMNRRDRPYSGATFDSWYPPVSVPGPAWTRGYLVPK